MDTIRVPVWGTLPPGWTFLSGLSTGEPGADELVVLDTRTWATAGRLAVHPASTNQARTTCCGPARDALADSDGFSLHWARWDGTRVSHIDGLAAVSTMDLSGAL